MLWRRSWPVGEGEEELQVGGTACAATLRTEELGLFKEQRGGLCGGNRGGRGVRSERWAGAVTQSPVAALWHLDLILKTVEVGKGFEPRRNII